MYFGEKLTENIVTLRDDGVALIDGKPFFPIGFFGVTPRESNGFSYDNAFSELKKIGCNIAQPYPGGRPRKASQVKELLESADRHGFKLVLKAGRDFTRSDFACNVLAERGHPSVFAWYLGDDTAGNVMPYQVRRSNRYCKALDNAHLTTQADPVLAGGGLSRYVPFVTATDSFLPEIYPVYKKEPVGDEVSSVVEDMRQISADVKEANAGARATWALVQYFSGFGAWKRYPTEAEIRAMSWLSIIHGARGIMWYTYHDFRDGKGACHTPENWAVISRLSREIADLSADLLTRDSARQPQVAVVSGPRRDARGFTSVSCLLKDGVSGPLLLAASSSTNAVTARISVQGFRTARTLGVGKGRAVDCRGGLTDVFPPLGVNIYRLEK